ncbi:MAG: beta-ketoacyl synthase chain length factor [Bacteroidales bacterium]|jgi:hypothetical protein
MFIKDLSCISPQYSYDLGIFENKIKNNTGNKFIAIEPDYSNLIPSNLLRRMGKATRMGIGTGQQLLKKSHKVEGIIIGTATGGLEDSMKFINQIELFQEGSLTPTNFIQSTPNSVAGLLSIMNDNSGYNATHVHNGLAFENALLDTKLHLEENEISSILTGNVDEISDWNFNIEYLAGYFKEETVSTESLLSSNTKGTVCGEGSSMFIIDSSPANALCQIKDLAQFCNPTESEIIKNIKTFLNRNNLKQSDIQALVFGLNGDTRTDYWYNNVYNELFKDQGIFTFKNLVGEYPTASAFAVFLSTYIIRGYTQPDNVILKAPSKEIKNILIYNHYKGLQHSLILLSDTKIKL